MDNFRSVSILADVGKFSIRFQFVFNSFCVQVLGVAAGANSSTRDYSPCTYGPDGDYTHEIYCNNKTAAEVVDAFRRNKNNPNIDAVLVSRMGDDMTAGILEEILEMVADSASHKVRLISLFSVPRMKTVPKAVQRFDHLRVLSLDLNDGLKVLRSGSFVFPSNSPPLMYSTRNPNLKAIQPGAFQGLCRQSGEISVMMLCLSMVVFQAISMAPSSVSGIITSRNWTKRFSSLFWPVPRPR